MRAWRNGRRRGIWAVLEGGARADSSESSAPSGARLVAEAQQWTPSGGKLAPGAVRGPRRGSEAKARDSSSL